jgi:hypothetical protein
VGSVFFDNNAVEGAAIYLYVILLNNVIYYRILYINFLIIIIIVIYTSCFTTDLLILVIYPSRKVYFMGMMQLIMVELYSRQ